MSVSKKLTTLALVLSIGVSQVHTKRASADPVSMIIGVTLTVATAVLYLKALRCYINTGHTACEEETRSALQNALPATMSHPEYAEVRESLKVRHQEFLPLIAQADPFSKEAENHVESEFKDFMREVYEAAAEDLKQVNDDYLRNIGKAQPPTDLVGLSLVWRKEDSRFANWRFTSEKIAASSVESLAKDLFIADVTEWKK